MSENIVWKRPCEIVSEPHLYGKSKSLPHRTYLLNMKLNSGHHLLTVDGTSRRDVIQGILGDCWLLSTCAAVAKREDLMHRVLDPSQVLFGPAYKGYIKVKLWRYKIMAAQCPLGSGLLLQGLHSLQWSVFQTPL